MRFLIVMICSVWALGTAVAQPHEHIAEAPDWIESSPIPGLPDARRDQVKDGIAYLLLEDLSQVTDTGFDFGYRLAYQVTERVGLENAARIAVDFDPEDTSIAFHEIALIRDGERINLLDQVEIQKLRQEQNLSSNSVDGELTLLVLLEDVRVGDIVAYAYHGHTSTPLWPGSFTTYADTEWSVPLVSYKFLARTPSSRPLTAKSVDTGVSATERRDGDWIEYRVELSDPDPVPGVNFVSPLENEFGYIALTSFGSWAEVSRLGADVFDIDKSLPAEVETIVDAIRSDHALPEARAAAALVYVQDDIRYLALLGGIGGHKPRPPKTTVERGYGDCKDKSVLLLAMLRALNIESKPVLANTSKGHRINDSLPTIGAFNHAIVQAKIGDTIYWLDPTLTHQRGPLSQFPVPDYGYVLPLDPRGGDLMKISVDPLDAPNVSVKQDFYFPDDGTEAFDLHVETAYAGEKANATRAWIASTGVQEIRRGYLNFYEKYYPGVTFPESGDGLRIEDDPATNTLIIKEKLSVSKSVAGRAKLFESGIEIIPMGMLDVLPTNIERNRTVGVALPYPFHAQIDVTVHTPGERIGVLDGKTLGISGVEFSSAYKQEFEKFRIKLDLRTSSRAIPVDDISDYIQLVADIDEAASLRLYPRKFQETLETQLGLNMQLPPEIRADILDIVSKISGEDTIGALSQTSELIDAYSKPDEILGYLYQVKGALLFDLNRYRAATASWRRSRELYSWPNQSQYFHFANATNNIDRDHETAEILAEMLERFPDSENDLSEEFAWNLIYDLQEAGETAAADRFKAAWAGAQLRKGNTEIPNSGLLVQVAETHLSAGKVSEAERFVSAIVDPDILVRMYMDRRFEAFWDEIGQRVSADAWDSTLQLYADHAREWVAKHPDDFDAKITYMDALLKAGDSATAAEFAEPVIEDWANIEAAGEEAFWFVNSYAAMLASAGDAEGARRLFDRLLEFDLDVYPSLISMAINKHIQMLDFGEYETALSGAKELMEQADDLASDYGKMYLFEVQICSLSKLSRNAEAKELLENEVLQIADENLHALTVIYMCLGDLDKAADTMIRRLNDEDTRSETINLLTQTEAAWGDRQVFQSEMDLIRKKLLARKDVKSAFEQFGVSRTVKGAPEFWVRF